MVIDVKLDGHPAKALVDQQTTGASLISSTYTSTYNLPIVELPEDVTIDLTLEGSRGNSTHYVIANLDIGGHTQPVTFCITALADWDIILGEPILRELKTKLDIGKCKMTRLEPPKTPITVEATTNRKRKRDSIIESAQLGLRRKTQMSLPLLTQRLSIKGQEPKRMTSRSAGYDLHSSEETIIIPHSRQLVATGIAITVPAGTYGRIAP